MIESKAHPKLGLRGRQVDVPGMLAGNGGAGYLLDDLRPGLAATARGLHPKALEIARTSMPAGTEARLVATTRRPAKRWRRVLRSPKNDQNPYGGICTGAGPLTAVHCLKLGHAPVPRVHMQTYYAMNVANDLARGVDFRSSGGGATTLSAMETGVQLGLFGGFYWTFKVETALDTLVEGEAGGAIVMGTDWPEGWFETDREGIARLRRGPRSAGGHCYAFRGLDYVTQTRSTREILLARGLLVLPQTWGDLRSFDVPNIGRDEMLVPVEDAEELLERRDGECAAVRELPDDRFVPPPAWALPGHPRFAELIRGA